MSYYNYTGKTNTFFTKGKTYHVETNNHGEYTTDDDKSDEHELSDDYLSKNFVGIYTQAMFDAGTLPSVGMECMVYVEENDVPVRSWFKGLVCGEYKGLPIIKLDDIKGDDGAEGYFDVFDLIDLNPILSYTC